MSGEVRFTYASADMVAMQNAWWAGAARWQAILRTWLIVLALYLVLFAGIDLIMDFKDGLAGVLEAAKVALVLATVVTVAVFAIGRVLAPFLGRRTLRDNRLIGGEYHWRWDETALHIVSERGHVNVPWGLFAGWLDAPKVMLLYQTRRLVFALPKRALAAGDAERLIAVLRDQAVPERKRFGFISARAAPASGDAP